jgi:hypothetical protein
MIDNFVYSQTLRGGSELDQILLIHSVSLNFGSATQKIGYRALNDSPYQFQ